MAIDNKDLEKALNNLDRKEEKDLGMSKEMEIGFHQGSLNTLINERNELLKMAQVTEQLMQAHMKRLGELGVKINFGSEKK
jgi:hypothetical protein